MGQPNDAEQLMSNYNDMDYKRAMLESDTGELGFGVHASHDIMTSGGDWNGRRSPQDTNPDLA